MPTEKPRVTITMSKDQLDRIDDYRFEGKMKNQTQAILSLIELGFAELSSANAVYEKAPSLSDEAMQIAKDYSVLDNWGKAAVRELVSTEKQRCEDEARFLADTQIIPFEPKVVNLFLEPSAAGIAAPVEGKDFEPYELQPDEPQGAAYAIRVQGDSMEPDFPDGSIVFVNHDAIANGDIGVFCVDGGTVIKQYYHDPLGMTYLFSLNRKRADADVLIRPSSGQTVVCQGRVITKRRYPLPR